MSAKNNSESEYYGEILSRDVRLLTNMLAKNNSESEYYGKDLIT